MRKSLCKGARQAVTAVAPRGRARGELSSVLADPRLPGGERGHPETRSSGPMCIIRRAADRTQ